jgi:hypothetical protein
MAIIKNRAVDLSRICIWRYKQSHHAQWECQMPTWRKSTQFNSIQNEAVSVEVSRAEIKVLNSSLSILNSLLPTLRQSNWTWYHSNGHLCRNFQGWTYTSNAFINTTLTISIALKKCEKIMTASSNAVIKNRAVDLSRICILRYEQSHHAQWECQMPTWTNSIQFECVYQHNSYNIHRIEEVRKDYES